MPDRRASFGKASLWASQQSLRLRPWPIEDDFEAAQTKKTIEDSMPWWQIWDLFKMSPRELLPLADSLAIFLVEYRSQIPCVSDLVEPVLWSHTELSRPGVSYHAVREAGVAVAVGSAVRVSQRCEATGRGSPYRDGSMHQARHRGPNIE